MPDRPIIGDDARIYIKYVGNHGLHEDIRWLINVGRFPVGCRVLDVGCGTGTLVATLAGERQFARSVIGIELSQDLVVHARNITDRIGGTIIHGDFMQWTPSGVWRPDTMVMSYFLHHCDDAGQHLRNAASLLPHGGRLYILDRVALDQSALDSFPRFWEEQYRSAHEWSEDMPRLMTSSGLVNEAKRSGFTFIGQQICPHDKRNDTDRFPKTLMEFWRNEGGRAFPAILVVSPAHQGFIDEIVRFLKTEDLLISRRCSVSYSDNLIRTIYRHCPWREPLIQFIAEECPERTVTALEIGGDSSNPDLLARLGQFKKAHRNRWKNIEGPVTPTGFKAIILPFHVAEPYESEELAQAVGLSPER